MATIKHSRTTEASVQITSDELARMAFGDSYDPNAKFRFEVRDHGGAGGAMALAVLMITQFDRKELSEEETALKSAESSHGSY
ncbi:MAG: hypothetical protein AB7G13_11625 [Lautropia sp.]